MEKIQNTGNQRLPLKVKLGYGAGGASDAIAFEFVAAFLLFFLTDMAGVDPVFGGMITSIAVLWDAITDPIIGNLSDRTKTKLGRRRPWLLATTVPLVASTIFLFSTVDMVGDAKNAYYLVCALVFWVSYTAFAIPYYALGPTLTANYDDRTVMRVIAQSWQYVGVFISTALPAYIVAWLLERGSTDAEAWSTAAAIIAVSGGVLILVVFLSTKGRDIIPETETKENSRKTNFFKDCLEILKMRSFLIITASAVVYRVGYAFFLVSIIYYCLYNAGLDEGAVGLFYTVLSAAGLAFVLLLGVLAKKIDKKAMIVIFIGISGLIMIGFSFINISTLTMLMIYAVFYTPGAATFWTLNIGVVYDLAEIDEFKNNKRREGTTFAFFLFTSKLGYAAAAMLSGTLLSAGGYDPNAEVQTEAALNQINNMFTLYPGIMFVLSALIMLAFPINKKRHELLTAQLELKRAGKEYNTEGFEKLLK